MAMLTPEILAVELLTIVPQVLMCTWVYCRLLPLRRPVLFTVLYTMILTVVHVLLMRVFQAPVWVKPLLQMVIALVLPCIFTRGSRVSALCLTLIQCTAMVLMELIMVAVTQWDQAVTGMVYFSSVPLTKLLQLRTLYNVIYCLLLIPVYFQWKRTRNCGVDYAAPELLPFLLCQTAMTILACAMLLTDAAMPNAMSLIAVAAALLGLLSMGVVLYAYLSNREWYRLERQRSQAAHQATLQRRRAESSEEDTEAERVRREVRNLLDEALRQLDRREQSEARTQVLDADRMLQASRTKRYCDHPVADAVLWEQARRCDEAGIRLDVRAAVPVEAGISGAVLCSLFSNVLDNAVHACLALPPRQRWIRCTAACRGPYLVLREENPWDPAAPVHAGPSSGHGYGLRILSELARRCDGSVEVCREKNRFRITVCLRREQTEAAAEQAEAGEEASAL